MQRRPTSTAHPATKVEPLKPTSPPSTPKKLPWRRTQSRLLCYNLFGMLMCIIVCVVAMTRSPTKHNESHQQQPSTSKKVDTNLLWIPTNYTENDNPLLQFMQLPNSKKSLESSLPSWSQITSLYGKGPRLWGHNTCRDFQTYGNPRDHWLGAAGMFNSGTNLLVSLLTTHCQLGGSTRRYVGSTRSSVPWGKHNPPELRHSHRTLLDKRLKDIQTVFPVVVIRDPYTWMQSMCRRAYQARWRHDREHCPNLVHHPIDPTRRNAPADWQPDTFAVHIRYTQNHSRSYESLVDLWNQWYTTYLFNVTFPRLIVRMEDLVVYGPLTVQAICECAGGTYKGPFQPVWQSAKTMEQGPNRTGWWDAIRRCGSQKERLRGFTKEDLAYARRHLDLDLMRIFGYEVIEESLST